MGEKFEAMPEELKEPAQMLAALLVFEQASVPQDEASYNAAKAEVLENIASRLEVYEPQLRRLMEAEKDYDALKSGEKQLHVNSRAWQHPDILEDLGLTPDDRPLKGRIKGDGGKGR